MRSANKTVAVWFFAAGLMLAPVCGVAAMDETPVQPDAAAADDFGGVRFHENSHSALDDGMGMTAEEAAGIEPAAGPTTPPALPTEEELAPEEGEEALDAPAGDSADAETVGKATKENVGLFYDHRGDESLGNGDEAIGMEFRILEFN